jgi:hypothetical protein|tara:strand:- start:59 stop:199 length:141 start_codon:yes stop_codon:yes gene_type:complete
MRLNVYRKPDEWLSMNITEEEWKEIKPYLEENKIWYTLSLGVYEKD